jgi:hypothetical protein
MAAHTASHWPALPFTEWADTCETLHLWTQIIGKIRLRQTPWINHSWHVPLYPTVRGLTTSPIPHGNRLFQIDLDFVEHRLRLEVNDGRSRTLALRPKTVAEFYEELMAELARLDVAVKIHGRPNEVADAIPFARDRSHGSYDPEYARRFWSVLLQTARVMQRFRARFLGKCSPIHFFWGSFDLAVTRFSGRPAPEHPGGMPNMPDWVVREAYSGELSSAGFWPGAVWEPSPLFYSYAYPEPRAFPTAHGIPEEAYYHKEMGEFVLPYESLRHSANPEQLLLDFFQGTYAAAADLAQWDRNALEWEPPTG